MTSGSGGRRFWAAPKGQGLAVASGLVILLLAWGWSLAADDGEMAGKDGNGAVQQKPAVRVVPWLEVNTLAQQRIDWAVEGLLVWQKVTDTAIISTKPGCAGIYPKLREAVPGMHIIPGMKTHSLLPQRFDSVEGWKAVAREVRAVCLAANENRVVMENEGALNSYWRKEYEIDPAHLRDGLKQLPSDIGYIWYPGFIGGSHSDERMQRAEKVCRIVDAGREAVFTDTTFGASSGLRYRQGKKGRIRTAAIKEIAKRPLVPMLYFQKGYWDYEDTLEVLRQVDAQARGDERVKETWCIVYPGEKRWVECARAFAEHLRARVPADTH